MRKWTAMSCCLRLLGRVRFMSADGIDLAKEIIYWCFMALCAWGVWALRPPTDKQ